MTPVSFSHRHAAHCESGVAANLITHAGLPLSEAMAFGLSAGLSFAYLPFIKLSGLPLIAYRTIPKGIIKGVAKSLALPFTFETFRTLEQGQARLDSLLDQGEVVGLQTSVFWLPYFPEDMRFHFNAHNLVVYAKEGDEYLVSDPVFERVTRCKVSDMNRARFAKGALAPKGLLYRMMKRPEQAISSAGIKKAIVKVCRTLLAPVPIAGVKGMRTLANKIRKLPVDDKKSLLFVGHVIRMQEEIGTGGAGFRFLYAAFLQEAAAYPNLSGLSAYSEQLMAIGDEWRMFALRVARMVRGREAFSPEVLADLLLAVASKEERYFKALKRYMAEVSC